MTNPMTRDAVEALLAKATPGPWLINGAMLGHKGDIFSPTAAHIKDCHHIARCFAPKPTRAMLSDLDVMAETNTAVAAIEANARAIATWPDLARTLLATMTELEQVKGTLAYCEKQWTDTDRITHSKMLDERARAEAAEAERDALLEYFEARERFDIEKTTGNGTRVVRARAALTQEPKP
jgi:hypothetical protein